MPGLQGIHLGRLQLPPIPSRSDGAVVGMCSLPSHTWRPLSAFYLLCLPGLGWAGLGRAVQPGR